MDHALRDRKLGSAAARKEKARQREEQEQRREAKQRKWLLYGYSRYDSDEDDIEEEMEEPKLTHDNSYPPTPDSEYDRSVNGPSTPSDLDDTTSTDTPATPASAVTEICPPLPQKSERRASQGLWLTLPNIDIGTIMPPKPSPNIIFSSTLNNPADFSFNAYPPSFSSLSVDDPNIPPPSPDHDDYEIFDTPVEVATPIFIAAPKSKPSMVAIRSSITSSARSRTSSIASPHSNYDRPSFPPRRDSRRSSLASTPILAPVDVAARGRRQSGFSVISGYPACEAKPMSVPSETALPLPAKSQHRLSNLSTKSGYPACEATPFELRPPMPVMAMEKISDAKRNSVIYSPAPASPVTAPARPVLSERKSSSNLLNRAGSFRKPRMSALKNLLSESPVENESSFDQQRPKTAVSTKQDRKTPSPVPVHSVKSSIDNRPSLTNLPPNRPRTATTSSNGSWSSKSVTALPPPPMDPLPSPQRASTRSALEIVRKKSLSTLRGRSESIGKALKSVSSSVRTKGRFPVKPGSAQQQQYQQGPTSYPAIYENDRPVPRISLHSRKQTMEGSVDLGSFPLPPERMPSLGLSMNMSRESGRKPEDFRKMRDSLRYAALNSHSVGSH